MGGRNKRENRHQTGTEIKILTNPKRGENGTNYGISNYARSRPSPAARLLFYYQIPLFPLDPMLSLFSANAAYVAPSLVMRSAAPTVRMETCVPLSTTPATQNRT